MTMQRDWFETDYYEALGVDSAATAKDITAAYRRLARQFHPDANSGDPGAEERFKAVSAAYDVVGAAERRREYDEVRGASQGSPLSGAQGAPGFGRPGDHDFDPQNPPANGDGPGGKLFGRGDKRTWSPSGPFSQGPQRGSDLEADLHLAFMDAVRGVTTSVNLLTESKCSDCNGTCAARGTTPRVCSDCSGRGVIDDNQGYFSLSHPCPTCSGRGSFIDTPCPGCKGTGLMNRPRVVRVKMPVGVKDGQQIRLKGKGGEGHQGGPDGDLYVRVNVEPHPLFSRDGDDLTLTVPITFTEATLGADIRVPTIDGDAVTIRVPAGTPRGRVFRVRARGVPTPNGSGDLLVGVDIAVPSSLNADERRAVEALGAAATTSPRAYLGV